MNPQTVKLRPLAVMPLDHNVWALVIPLAVDIDGQTVEIGNVFDVEYHAQ